MKFLYHARLLRHFQASAQNLSSSLRIATSSAVFLASNNASCSLPSKSSPAYVNAFFRERAWSTPSFCVYDFWKYHQFFNIMFSFLFVAYDFNFISWQPACNRCHSMLYSIFFSLFCAPVGKGAECILKNRGILYHLCIYSRKIFIYF